MATVSITIPDTLVPRVTTAMRAMFPQYAALTDAACFKKVTGDYWRSVVSGYEALQAEQAQVTQSLSDAAGIG